MRRKAIVLAAVLGALAVGGCDAGSSSEPVYGVAEGGDGPAPGLVPMARTPVEDVPVPIGFKMIEEMSRSHVAGDRRRVKHAYRGRVDKFDARRFYARQMPLSDWKPISEQFLGGEYVLQFAKGGELAEVTIASERSWGREVTTVRIDIAPKGEPEGEAPTTVDAEGGEAGAGAEARD